MWKIDNILAYLKTIKVMQKPTLAYNDYRVYDLYWLRTLGIIYVYLFIHSKKGYSANKVNSVTTLSNVWNTIDKVEWFSAHSTVLRGRYS